MGIEDLGNIIKNIFFVFAIVLAVIMGATIISEWNTKMGSLSVASTEAQEVTQKFDDSYYLYWDWAIGALVLGMILASAYTARKFANSPTFIVVCLLFLGVVVLASAITGNIYDDMVLGSPIISTQDSRMTVAPWIMDNILYIALFYSVFVCVAMFTKEDLG